MKVNAEDQVGIIFNAQELKQNQNKCSILILYASIANDLK